MSHSYQFQLTKALYDKEYAYRFWADYAHGNNTAQITADDYSQICNKWVNEIDKWEKWAQSIYSTDENDWYYSQEELDAFYENGMNTMNNNEFEVKKNNGIWGLFSSGGYSTTYERTDGRAAGQWASSIGNAVTGAAGATVSIARYAGAGWTSWGAVSQGATNSAGKNMVNAYGKAFKAQQTGNIADKLEAGSKLDAAKQDYSKAAERTSGEKQAGGDWSVLVSCAFSLASGILAQTTKANYEEGFALEAAGKVLTDTQGVLENAQLEMIDAKEEADEAYEKADEVNAEKEEQIAEQTALYDTYKSIIENTQAKVASGVPLTEVERAIYASAVEGLNIAGLAIETLQLEANDEVAVLRAEASEKTDAFLNASEKSATAQGEIDYVASFDKATKAGAIISMAGDALNVATSATVAYKAWTIAGSLSGPCTFWLAAAYYAGAIAAGAGGALSGVDFARQTKSLGQANDAIDTREVTEGINDATLASLDENYDSFDETIDTMTEIELVVPDDIETDATVNDTFADDDANLFAQTGQTRTDNSQNDNQNYHRYNTQR